MGGKSKSSKNNIARENYVFLVLLGFVALIVISLFVMLFLGNPDMNEVTRANCYAAESKGKCSELNAQYGGEMVQKCCESYDKCCSVVKD